METKETIQSVKFMLFMLSPRGDFGDDFNFCRMLDIFSGYFLWRDIGIYSLFSEMFAYQRTFIDEDNK